MKLFNEIKYRGTSRLRSDRISGNGAFAFDMIIINITREKHECAEYSDGHYVANGC